ncbi:hypothetical protein [Pseudodonghicola xiamenensis]|uniref:Uncharacterized protein n=2 Tax=Pseudodonghicola xiamenensis TaxID=337702 RepID=A0A8J3MCQ1_9RHOB|nr:hypothetical protein [Pseudodonghicola xiamenensis]GHG79057.1 hypothetical protein GCM10010961_00610 [Pseudodonghicola xiamenensis]
MGLILHDAVVVRMFLTLLAATMVMIVLYVIAGIWDGEYALAHVIRHNFDLGLDDVFAENFNHGLSFLVAVLMLLSFFEIRSRALMFLVVLYSFIWFDDSSQYHERAGGKIGAALHIPVSHGLGPQEYGELLAWVIAGLCVGAVFLWAWFGRRPGDLGVLLPFFMCFVLLVICAVVVDMLHAVLPAGFSELAGVVEDGGEMLAITASAGLAIGLSRHAREYYRAVSPAAAEG